MSAEGLAHIRAQITLNEYKARLLGPSGTWHWRRVAELKAILEKYSVPQQQPALV